jgi:arylsulfatase A-like enzyme
MTSADERRAIVMVWDGLRPDMITPERTPNLHALAATGVRYTDSHAVAPTVTRANAASIATGAQPAGHGIPGNTFYAPEVDPGRALATSDANHLRAYAGSRGGRLLDRPTLADRVHRAGGRSAVVSTGSSGSAFLQHPNVEASGDLMLHWGLWSGVEKAVVESELGPMPAATLPNTDQNAWFARVITDWLLPRGRERLIHFWHCDPDKTQHARGIGHPDTLASIRDADTNLGAILAALDRLGLRERTDIVITSDHGFASVAGITDVATALVDAGLKRSRESTDVVVTGGALYIHRDAAERIGRIVSLLQEMEGVGAIFRAVRGATLQGTGTLPLCALGVDGPLAPDLWFSGDWSDAVNEHGFPGAAWATPTSTPATHGSLARWDVNNTLVLAGPSFKRGLVCDVPAGNADIAPTLIHTLGLPADGELDGRVLSEALAGGPDPTTVAVERSLLRDVAATGRFASVIQVSKVGAARYVDWGRSER